MALSLSFSLVKFIGYLSIRTQRKAIIDDFADTVHNLDTKKCYVPYDLTWIRS